MVKKKCSFQFNLSIFTRVCNHDPTSRVNKGLISIFVPNVLISFMQTDLRWLLPERSPVPFTFQIFCHCFTQEKYRTINNDLIAQTVV